MFSHSMQIETGAGNQKTTGRRSANIAQKIRVAMVGTNEVVRKCLHEIFDRREEFVGCGFFRRGGHAFEGITRSRADLVLVETQLQDMCGIRCATELQKKAPGLRAIVLSPSLDRAFLHHSFAVGIRDFPTLPFSMEQCLATLRAAVYRREMDARYAGMGTAGHGHTAGVKGEQAKGQLVNPDNGQITIEQPFQAMDDQCARTTAWFRNHERANRVMSCLANGLLYKEIEDQLHLSGAMVKKLQHQAYMRLGVEFKMNAVNKWKALGFGP